MPVYNGAGTLERTVRSVIAQSFANWELVLVEDCSTDGSGGIAEGLAAGDATICLIRKSENTGVGATRNVGLRSPGPGRDLVGPGRRVRRVGQDREASEGPPEPGLDQMRQRCDSQDSPHPTAEGLGRVAPQYLTFVNPHPVKGLYVFSRIAEQIARRRPEIPILVVDKLKSRRR